MTDDLSKGERQALEAVGVTKVDNPPMGPIQKAAELRHQLEATAFNTKQVAEHLRIGEEDVFRRSRERSLFAFRGSDGILLFPHWQFVSTGELPGVGRVLMAIPKDLDLLDVDGFLTSTNCDLEDDDWNQYTPIEWLTEGRDLDTLIHLAWRL